jgi:hypothetical protein
VRVDVVLDQDRDPVHQAARPLRLPLVVERAAIAAASGYGSMQT